MSSMSRHVDAGRPGCDAGAGSQVVRPEHRPRPSARHIEALRLVAEDRTNEQIAAQLGVSLQTVKNHVQEVGLRLGVRSRAGAVGRAYRLGILLARTDPAADAVRAQREQAARLAGIRLAASTVQPQLAVIARYGELLLASPDLAPGLRASVHQLLTGTQEALRRLNGLTQAQDDPESSESSGAQSWA